MLVSEKELTNLKLKAVKADDLKELAASVDVEPKGNASDLIKKLIGLPQNKIDSFIKTKYQAQVKERQKLISDSELVKGIVLNKERANQDMPSKIEGAKILLVDFALELMNFSRAVISDSNSKPMALLRYFGGMIIEPWER